MPKTQFHVDEDRAEALAAAVSAGGAPSVQAAVERAVDAWLVNQALGQVSDEALQQLWREGLDSGDAGAIDFSALKAQARRPADAS